LSSLPAHVVGRKTLISHGSTDRGQATNNPQSRGNRGDSGNRAIYSQLRGDSALPLEKLAKVRGPLQLKQTLAVVGEIPVIERLDLCRRVGQARFRNSLPYEPYAKIAVQHRNS
jgi:hypothetical protein